MLSALQKIAIVENAKNYKASNSVNIVERSWVSPVVLNDYKKLYIINAFLQAIVLNTTKSYWTTLQEEVVYRSIEKLLRGY